MSRTLKVLSHYKGEIFTGIGLIAGAGAVVCSFLESPKARANVARHKQEFDTLRLQKNSGEKDLSNYKREYLKQGALMAKDFAWDMKKTIGLELLSVGFGIAGCATMRKAVTAAATAAASATSLLAMTEAAIKDEYGEEGFQKICEKRRAPLKISERRVNPETGEVEEHEYVMEPPEEVVLDSHVKDIVDQLPPDARAGINLAHCVLIDNGNFAFRNTNGNLDLIIPQIKGAFFNINRELQVTEGEINVRRELEILGFMDTHDSRFNQTILKVAGTIDTPTAKDLVTGKTIRVKGFNTDGTAEGRYGEHTHKQISFGEDQDKYLFATVEERDEIKPWFIIDGKIILDLSYDGNIAELIPEKVSLERKRSAWIETPEFEK